MIEYFEDKKRPKTPDYAIFQADEADTVITLYNSGKAVFQGVSADIDANMWRDMERHLNPTKQVEMTNSEDKKKKEKKEIYIDPKIYNSTSIGSDEVGTGDYFGPIVVTSAYVNKENIKFLEELGVKDSKKLTDEKILQIVPQIIKKIPYECMILSNEEYNQYHSTDFNMNKVKAILHNKCLLSVIKKDGVSYSKIVVDQFEPEKAYYAHIAASPEKVTNITFMTKAEDQCMSVAASSIISRYIFLKEMKKLSDRFSIEMPLGASNLVDEVGATLVKKYGKDILKQIAKLSFKNTDKILEIAKSR
jgi:ribonuclease HIII